MLGCLKFLSCGWRSAAGSADRKGTVTRIPCSYSHDDILCACHLVNAVGFLPHITGREVEGAIFIEVQEELCTWRYYDLNCKKKKGKQWCVLLCGCDTLLSSYSAVRNNDHWIELQGGQAITTVSSAYQSNGHSTMGTQAMLLAAPAISKTLTLKIK